MPINPITLAKLAANDPLVAGLDLTLEVNSDDDVVKLVHALKGNSNLTSLTIQGRWNSPGITDESAKLLATCNHLVFLDISGNKNITNIGAAALARNVSIESLFMRGCYVAPAGLYPFLENEAVTDLRIATSASREEQEGDAINEKLNKNKKFKAKIQMLSADELNLRLYEVIQMNPSCIQKLPKPLQSIAQKHPEDWDDAMITGLTLANHLSKLWQENDAGLRTVAKFSAIYAKRYRALYEQQKRLMQFPAVSAVEQRKKQKVEEVVVVEERHIASGSPDI